MSHNKHFARFLLMIFVIILACLPAPAQNSKDEAKKGSDIVFKMPDKFMQAPLQGFKGLMLLNPDAPAVILISYPNENESMEELTKRLKDSIPKVFVGEKEKQPVWTSKAIEVNNGDKPGSGALYAGEADEKILLLALFQREWKGFTFVFGYFAMRTAKDKEKSVKKYWLDENGRGIKPFEAFWRSFPTKRSDYITI